jgi:hypothetical protein
MTASACERLQVSEFIGLAAYYSRREAYFREQAEAALVEAQEYEVIAERYRRLADEAAAAEGLA